MNVLNTVYSWPFFVGLILGISLYQGYICSKNWWLNKHHPLPDGKKRKLIRGLNHVWIGGALTVLILGYVLHQAQRTHDETVALSIHTAECQRVFQKALNDRADANAQDNDLANEQSDLRAQGDDARNLWLSRLLNPPSPIAELEYNNPRRVAWNQDVTREYADKGVSLASQIKDVLAQRKKVQADRDRNHPLPETSCG